MLNAETQAKKLARLTENCICPNCGTQSKYGFSTVCIKYYTFVCNLCKTAHQAVSHRCKSLTMSSWDQGEVLKLKMNGNKVARKSWLAGAPEFGVGGRPKEGDDVNVFKRFVVAAYENKRYYREAGDALTAASNEARAAPSQSQPRRQRAVARSQEPTPAPVPVPVTAVDLLDFGAFDCAPAIAAVPQAINAKSDDFADFGAFDSAPATKPTSSEPSNPGRYDFSDFSQAQPANSAQPTFDPFKNDASITSKATTAQTNAMKDPFAPSSASNAATHDLLVQSTPAATQNAATFDPINNNASSRTISSNVNSHATKNKTPVMNSMNIMGGGSSGNNMSNMMGNMNMGNGMNPDMAMNANQNMVMMNNGMMRNQGMMNQQQQQQVMMMKLQQQHHQQQQQQQQHNNVGMMGHQSINNNMINRGVGMGMQSNNINMMGNSNGMNSMNMNIMQKNSNTISNSFGADRAPSVPKKIDPFTGMGF